MEIKGAIPGANGTPERARPTLPEVGAFTPRAYRLTYSADRKIQPYIRPQILDSLVTEMDLEAQQLRWVGKGLSKGTVSEPLGGGHD